jgi:hypothetical protein
MHGKTDAELAAALSEQEEFAFALGSIAGPPYPRDGL